MILSHSYEQSPRKRASARMVETYLKDVLEQMDPGRIDIWLNSQQI